MAPTRGLEEIEANIDIALVEMHAGSVEAANESIEAFVEDARALAPVDPGGRKDRKPGDLRDSIKVIEVVDTGDVVEASGGTSLFYGPDQEFGTVSDPAHPFIRPARQKMQETFMVTAKTKINESSKLLAHE